MAKVVAFLVLAAAGVGAVLAGISWDAVQHAKDAGLASREGIFTLTNPSHALLSGGVAAAVVGVAGALYAALGDRMSSQFARRGYLAATSCVVAVAVIASGWAFRKQGEQSSPLMKEAAESVALAQQANAAAPAPVAPAAPAAPVAQVAKAAPVPEFVVPDTADELLAKTKATLAKYANLHAALDEGYAAYTPVNQPIVHYNNFGYMSDGRVVDTARPESLVYVNNTKRGWTLIGAMYLLNKPGDKPPHIKPGIRWHAHLDICFKQGTAIMAGSKGEFGGTCPAGTVNTPSAAMLHVWMFDNPDGPFSTDMEPDTMRQLVGE